jgi:hypothetical protein
MESIRVLYYLKVPCHHYGDLNPGEASGGTFCRLKMNLVPLHIVLSQ